MDIFCFSTFLSDIRIDAGDFVLAHTIPCPILIWLRAYKLHAHVLIVVTFALLFCIVAAVVPIILNCENPSQAQEHNPSLRRVSSKIWAFDVDPSCSMNKYEKLNWHQRRKLIFQKYSSSVIFFDSDSNSGRQRQNYSGGINMKQIQRRCLRPSLRHCLLIFWCFFCVE